MSWQSVYASFLRNWGNAFDYPWIPVSRNFLLTITSNAEFRDDLSSQTVQNANQNIIRNINLKVNMNYYKRSFEKAAGKWQRLSSEVSRKELKTRTSWTASLIFNQLIAFKLKVCHTVCIVEHIKFCFIVPIRQRLSLIRQLTIIIDCSKKITETQHPWYLHALTQACSVSLRNAHPRKVDSLPKWTAHSLYSQLHIYTPLRRAQRHQGCPIGSRAHKNSRSSAIVQPIAHRAIGDVRADTSQPVNEQYSCSVA